MLFRNRKFSTEFLLEIQDVLSSISNKNKVKYLISVSSNRSEIQIKLDPDSFVGLDKLSDDDKIKFQHFFIVIRKSFGIKIGVFESVDQLKSFYKNYIYSNDDMSEAINGFNNSKKLINIYFELCRLREKKSPNILISQIYKFTSRFNAIESFDYDCYEVGVKHCLDLCASNNEINISTCYLLINEKYFVDIFNTYNLINNFIENKYPTITKRIINWFKKRK